MVRSTLRIVAVPLVIAGTHSHSVLDRIHILPAGHPLQKGDYILDPDESIVVVSVADDGEHAAAGKGYTPAVAVGAVAERETFVQGEA
jgi:hypothetical protein